MTFVSDKVIYRGTILNMRSGRKFCKKWWDNFWTQTITRIPIKTQRLLFWPIYNVPWNLHAKFIPWYLQ